MKKNTNPKLRFYTIKQLVGGSEIWVAYDFSPEGAILSACKKYRPSIEYRIYAVHYKDKGFNPTKKNAKYIILDYYSPTCKKWFTTGGTFMIYEGIYEGFGADMAAKFNTITSSLKLEKNKLTSKISK